MPTRWNMMPLKRKQAERIVVKLTTIQERGVLMWSENFVETVQSRSSVISKHCGIRKRILFISPEGSDCNIQRDSTGTYAWNTGNRHQGSWSKKSGWRCGNGCADRKENWSGYASLCAGDCRQLAGAADDKIGDKVGQLVIMPVLIPDFTFESWEERVTGAFESTGR